MDRGQAHTLEAFIAAILLISAVIFATQATAVTPLSASTSNQHIENQLRATADDLLAVEAEAGTLRDAVVYWNTSNREFAGAPEEGYFANGGPPNDFGAALNETFRDRSIAFNVYVTYQRVNDSRTTRMVYMGSPSDNAVSASQTVYLYNETMLTGPQDVTVSDASTESEFYRGISNASEGELFNVVEVRLVVWRM